MGDRRERVYERDYERDYEPPRRPPPRPRSESGYYERREERFEEPRRARATEQVDVRVRERSRSRGPDRPDPLARYFREDPRPADAGQLVLRQREVETVERPRPRPRSPTPVRYREVIRREERNLSPPSPDRENVNVNVNVVKRDRSPSPSPSPSPPPPRPVIKGPVIEREVITHYRDVDHGVVYARPPPPPPPPPPEVRKRDTEIDIQTSRNRTDVDISHSHSRERRSSRPLPMPGRFDDDDEVIVKADRSRLQVDVDKRGQRRSRSENPPLRRYPDEVYDEADYIESRIDDRGRIGEAYNGATRDWTIVDVPPGTERVKMHGAGGGGAEVTWQRYSGVRRTKFVPNDDDAVMTVAVPDRERDRVIIRDRDRRWDRDLQVIDRDAHRAKSRDRVNVQISDDNRGRDQVSVDVDSRDYAPARRDLVPAGRDDMWTEITKDLVTREAIEQLDYDYSETEDFFYVLEYLRYEDVQELVDLTDRIRRRRERERERQRLVSKDEIDVDVRRRRSTSRHRPRIEERVYERDVVSDHLHPDRVYYR